MRKAFFLIVSIVSIMFSDCEAYKYEVSACAIFQNEAPYLKEWIEYHRLIGVEHFWLYNNSSTDDYKDVLKSYIKKGIVDLIDWPSPEDKDWTPYQKQAYCDCLKKATGKTHWLAVIDLDEFIVPNTCDTLQEFLLPYGNCGGILVHWQMFGTSGYWEIPEGSLMTECLYRKGEKEAHYNINVKSIVQPHRCQAFAVHHAIYKPGSSHHYPHDAGSGKIRIKQIQINHYWTRDEKFFREVKADRRARYEGNEWSENTIQNHLDRLDKEDDFSISRFLPALHQAVFQ